MSICQRYLIGIGSFGIYQPSSDDHESFVVSLWLCIFNGYVEIHGCVDKLVLCVLELFLLLLDLDVTMPFQFQFLSSSTAGQSH